MAAEDPFPPRSGIRGPRARLAARVADAALAARQSALGVGRALDRAAEAAPIRKVLVLGVYDRAEAMTAAVERLRTSHHDVAFALGARGPVAAALEVYTAASDLEGGKFANLNRLAEVAQPLAHDWLVVIDDDVELGRAFLDRMLYVAEYLGLHLAQPALTRASHTAWEVTRRRSALARRTRFVEIGPLTLMHREAWRELAPFPEQGMGWGLDLHWAAVAEREGWKLGVIDAVPVRHEARPPAAGYDHAAALAAAREFLAGREHLGWREAEVEVERITRLP